MDMQKIPAVQQKRIVTFVNHFIIDTVTLLNKFISSSENTLWKLEKRMRKLESTLKLLETKLNFIPDTVQVQAAVTEIPTSVPENVQKKQEEQIESNLTTPEASADPIENTVKEIPAEILKYHKMVQFGVPVQAVKLKMQREGFDPNLLP